MNEEIINYNRAADFYACLNFHNVHIIKEMELSRELLLLYSIIINSWIFLHIILCFYVFRYYIFTNIRRLNIIIFLFLLYSYYLSFLIPSINMLFYKSFLILT